MSKSFPHVSHWGAFWAEVEEGRLIGTRPFEGDPAPSDLIEAFPQMVYSPLRIKRPHVRRGYLAKDGGQGRGSDEYIALPWDEALDMGAEALRQTKEAHGNAAISGGSYGWSSAGRVHHARTALRRFLNAFGGATFQWSNYSYGAADALMPHIVGEPEAMNAPLTEYSQIAKHARMVLAFGGLPAKNWQVQSGGSGVHAYEGHMEALRNAGVEVVTVSPFGGDHPQDFKGHWQPIRPHSDTALILALIRQIDRDGAADEDFLSRYTQGGDELRAYLSGAQDSVEKGPEWAADLTGISAETIIALARKLVATPVMLTMAWSLQRAQQGEQPFWALVALAAILGRIGLPGQGYGFGYSSMNGNGNAPYRTPVFGLPSLPEDRSLRPIPVARITDMLLKPGEAYEFNGETRHYPFIDLIYWAGGNPFHHHQDLKRLSQGFRRVSHVLVNEQFWNPLARHADIVFPATMTLERSDYSGSSRDRFIMAMPQAIAPLGEARDDYDIFAGLAARLGIEDIFTEGKTAQDWLHLAWEKTRKSLAARDIAAPSFDEFWTKGHFEMPPTKPYTQFARFRADPEGAPLRTPSGKIMLVNEAVKGRHAHWAAPDEWLGGSLAAKYPFHLLSPQPQKRLHSQLEASDISASQKVDGREKLRISQADAQALGLQRGDLVDVFNDRGSLIAVAWPEDQLVQGVVMLPTGAHYDPDEAGNDRNSNPNVLTKDVGTSDIGQGCAAQSCLVGLRKRQSPAPQLRAHDLPLGVAL